MDNTNTAAALLRERADSALENLAIAIAMQRAQDTPALVEAAIAVLSALRSAQRAQDVVSCQDAYAEAEERRASFEARCSCTAQDAPAMVEALDDALSVSYALLFPSV